jgi:predicted nucleic acid-binding protein
MHGLIREGRREPALYSPGSEPPPLPAPVCRDPDDDAVLALAADVDFIVSGDNDLLVLQTFEGIPVLSPVDALLVIGVG